MYDLFTGVVLARPYVGRHKDKPQMLVRNIGRLTDFGRHLVLKLQDGIKLEKKRLFIVDDATLLRQREARPLSILSTIISLTYMSTYILKTCAQVTVPEYFWETCIF